MLRELHLAKPYRYDINLNCGCPSSRVESGAFGAVLMLDPGRVADLCLAMREGAPNTEITVKCRIGVEGKDSYDDLASFVRTVSERSPVNHFIVHARIAVLNRKLSPHANRNIPPLQYHNVHRLVGDFPHLSFTINGGIMNIDDAMPHIQEHGCSGVMIGRAAASDPYSLARAGAAFYGCSAPLLSRRQILTAYAEYAKREEKQGARKHALIKPLLNLFKGQRGGARWRRALSSSLMHANNGAPDCIEIAIESADQGVLDSTAF